METNMIAQIKYGYNNFLHLIIKILKADLFSYDLAKKIPDNTKKTGILTFNKNSCMENKKSGTFNPDLVKPTIVWRYTTKMIARPLA